MSNKVKFSDRHTSLGGVLSVILGSITILLSIVAIAISYANAGQGPLVVGALGIAAFLFDLCGLVIGLVSFKEQDKYYTTSVVGTLMCGVLFVLFFSILMMGLF